MLSADNFVQAPGATQSYNRYAYVFNNPLKYTDPSGEYIIAAIAAVAVFTYFSTAYANRDENGRWAWNPADWFGKGGSGFQVGVSVNPNSGSTSVYGGITNPNGTSLILGANTGTGAPGGGISAFGQPSYTSFSAPGGTGSINWSYVDRANQYNTGNIDNSFNKIPDITFQISGPDLELPDGLPTYEPRVDQLAATDVSLMDEWSESEGIVASISYNFVDGIAVTGQSFILGSDARHINGRQVRGSDRMDGFVNTASWSVAIARPLRAINSNNWLRVGTGYNQSGNQVFRIGLGAHSRYAAQIKSPYLRSLNQWLRRQNGGHFDLW